MAAAPCPLLQPVSLLSVFATMFVALANMYIQIPHLAYTISVLVTVALITSAAVATVVSWLVFPEFCHDEVRQCRQIARTKLIHQLPRAPGTLGMNVQLAAMHCRSRGVVCIWSPTPLRDCQLAGLCQTS